MSKSTGALVGTAQWLSCVIEKKWTQSSKRLTKRDEELCTDEASSLPKYFAEYDIESQQPRSGHAKPKIADVKVTE